MSTTWQADDHSIETSASPDLRKQVGDTTEHSDENETVPDVSSEQRARLKAAAAQSDDNDTIISFSPEQRALLKAAAKSAESKTVEIDPNEFKLEAQTLAGNALLKNHTTVVFALIDSEVLLPIHVTDRMVIGRPDVESRDKVDIDLTPYGGREKGVSRRHAVLYRTVYTVSIVDLNSSNGTYLNGVRLVPHQPRLLREGDEVRLGNMRFHTYFDR